MRKGEEREKDKKERRTRKREGQKERRTRKREE
jgi:hypothetical protein